MSMVNNSSIFPGNPSDTFPFISYNLRDKNNHSWFNLKIFSADCLFETEQEFPKNIGALKDQNRESFLLYLKKNKSYNERKRTEADGEKYLERAEIYEYKQDEKVEEKSGNCYCCHSFWDGHCGLCKDIFLLCQKISKA